MLALSFEGLQKLLPALPDEDPRARLENLLAKFDHSPLTGIHLWFDREITQLAKHGGAARHHHAVALQYLAYPARQR